MARPEKLRLGDLLIQQKLISAQQLQFALDVQKTNGRKLGRVLADNGFITEEQMSEMLARQLNIPYVNLKNHALNLDLVRQLPESEARRFRALPLGERKGVMLVGMADPTDTAAFDELGQTLGRTIELAVVTEGQLLETIERVYRRTEEISGLVRGLAEDKGRYVVSFGTATDDVGVEEMAAVAFLKSLFSEAVQARASSIHLDLQQGRLQTRLRQDGRLQAHDGVDGKMAVAAIQCLKQMSGLDTAEKHLPQNGHLEVRVDGKPVDVLVASLPVKHGESVMLRLANMGEQAPSLDALDLPPQAAARLREIVRRGTGMVLVTDPAGNNGATLYAVLAEIRAGDRKILTVEDPVAYSLPGLAQVQVDQARGMDFPHALRSAVRQDPDALLVGEMPDAETAQTGLRAAMSGCLVLAGLNARDAADSLVVLADMGVPDYMVASALQAILAQRRLRRVCDGCGVSYTPSAQEAAWLKQAGARQESWSGLRQGRGCAQCGGTGYGGNVTVYELLEMDADLADAVTRADTVRLMDIAYWRRRGYTLIDHAMAQMVQGRTTVAEVMRLGAREQG